MSVTIAVEMTLITGASAGIVAIHTDPHAQRAQGVFLVGP